MHLLGAIATYVAEIDRIQRVSFLIALLLGNHGLRISRLIIDSSIVATATGKYNRRIHGPPPDGWRILRRIQAAWKEGVSLVGYARADLAADSADMG